MVKKGSFMSFDTETKQITKRRFFTMKTNQNVKPNVAGMVVNLQ